MNSDVLAKAFGEREAVRIGDAMGDTIESAQSEVMTVWKGMNSWKDGTWAYAWLTESQVRPAGLPQWEQQVTARVAATKKSPASPPAVRYRTTLGPSARFITARYFDKWSDIDGWPVLKDVVGQVEADKIDALARGSHGIGHQLRHPAPGGAELHPDPVGKPKPGGATAPPGPFHSPGWVAVSGSGGS